jgi:hypothetical protein
MISTPFHRMLANYGHPRFVWGCSVDFIRCKELNFWNFAPEAWRHRSLSDQGILGHYRVTEQITWRRAPPLANHNFFCKWITSWALDLKEIRYHLSCFRKDDSVVLPDQKRDRTANKELRHPTFLCQLFVCTNHFSVSLVFGTNKLFVLAIW